MKEEKTYIVVGKSGDIDWDKPLLVVKFSQAIVRL